MVQERRRAPKHERRDAYHRKRATAAADSAERLTVHIDWVRSVLAAIPDPADRDCARDVLSAVLRDFAERMSLPPGAVPVPALDRPVPGAPRHGDLRLLPQVH
ncbi:hypothetical protein GCM10010156_21300 [Planobispora rosea]|uniref:Uncharacterized protein n=1 Tax=Planobispora rosea TaxID=35762 RepID=A0A8J3S222_PLARO|nr:hypothetical protein GCM10010156_21300 [Planobispora rosea]GIH84357.1 hypothetical protein Pro02_27650 [Planobispora rosea]